jgi:hypothetical protein
MYSAGLFSKQEKIGVTKIANILSEAGSICFTVCFNIKVDEKAVRERLASVKEAELKNAKDLANEILSGKEITAVGRLVNSDPKLGRSLIIDLPTGGFKQVDHRTIKWLIF